MPRHRLFCPALDKGLNLLSPEESHHAVASLRAKPGETVSLFDGRGRDAVGQITRIHRRRLEVNVVRFDERPFDLRWKLTLAVAMGRAHRQGYLIEKCTELGVAAVWPVITKRSVSKPDAGAVEKWTRRAVEAAKQSGRSWVPDIASPQQFDTVVNRIGEFTASAFTHPDSDLARFDTFLTAQPAESCILTWVGPEGGWTDAEREQLAQSGAVPTTLAPTVLRTETAAVAVMATTALLSTQNRRTT